jgi:hypothetical protein
MRSPQPSPSSSAPTGEERVDESPSIPPAPPPVRCGVAELRRLLDEQTDDVRGLDLHGFRRWLGCHLERWRRDAVFQQRCRIRDLRHAQPQLRKLERALRSARVADEASPEHAHLSRLEKAVADAGKAIDGLTAAAECATGGERTRLLRKRVGFRRRLARLSAELDGLATNSPARVERDRIADRLRRLREETGIDGLEEELSELLRERGRGSSRHGARFEDVAAGVVQTHVLPRLAEAEAPTSGSGSLGILRGVTIGAAGIEIDQLVVRSAATPGDPADVLAMVEAKRDVNDVAHGFRKRQMNLAWLTGDADGYDPAAFRTRSFPTGHFDRAAVHEQNEQRFLLTRASFRRFGRDPASGFFVDRLYFVTRAGTLWGAGRAAMSRLAYRVATDERWDLESDDYVEALSRWLLAQTHAMESPDVLRLYAVGAGRARQVLLADG